MVEVPADASRAVGSVRSRNAVLLAAACVALAAGGLLLSHAREPAATDALAAVAPAARMAAGARSATYPPMPLPGVLPLPAVQPPAVQQPSPPEVVSPASARLRTTAAARFGFEAMPTVDACLGPSPGMRMPRPFIVRFVREPGQERFAAAEVAPLGPPLPPTSPLSRCLLTLVGRPLELDDPALGARTELRQIVNLVLPAGGPMPMPPGH
ncbi:MAG: hypothetical protein JWM10_2017 [Myxococcaceae bacterium]|nr:hypothetical protein [Myxococcaceae bacterium]